MNKTGYTSSLLTGSAIGVNFADQTYAGGQVTISNVPEPGVWALLLIGMGGLGVSLRARRRADLRAAAVAG